ncbi:MAG TPA: trypsin-like peptidase domain-containing protein [Terracidiphilus sp.]|nr:trypsin-like peptidase domain-containing protein [Terracidiphilus sp.]
MIQSTNSLVARTRRLVLPVGLVASIGLCLALLFGHGIAQAATSSSVAASGPLPDSQVSALIALDHAMEALTARVTPAVVNVSVTSRPENSENSDRQGSGGMPQNLPPEFRWFFGNGMPQQQRPQYEYGIGSGVIISPDGYILTNDHVVNGAVQIHVTLDDRRVFPAKLIGIDKLNDLAVIKIDAHNLTTIPWGNSTDLHPGQTVLAFGSPFGYFHFSVTRGIVSALNRPNPYSSDRRKPGDYIQTDAAINPGNSGGPLVDANGELIGINTFIITNSGSFAGAGFAIPSQIARASANDIIKFGTVRHGYLGITMNDVTPDNSSFFNLPDATGAIISQVTPDSPASRAGLKSGDVLREIDGHKIVNGSALQVAVTSLPPGTHIKLGIIRNGKPITLSVTVGEYHGASEVSESGPGSNTRGHLGLTVANLTPEIRSQLGVPDDVKGAAIQSIRPASPADNAGLAPGEVITEVNRHPVADADSFVSQVQAIPPGKDILVLVWSKSGTFFRVLHPDEAPSGGSNNQ